jgi:histone H3
MAKTKNTLRDPESSRKTKEKKAEKHARVMKQARKSNGESLKGVGGIKKPHRFRAGTVAKREIRKYQSGRTPNGTRLLVPKSSISRRIREAVALYSPQGMEYRLQSGAEEALQSSLEDLMVNIFDKTGELSVLQRKKTLSRRNFKFATTFFLRYYLKDTRSEERAAESAQQRKERMSGKSAKALAQASM